MVDWIEDHAHTRYRIGGQVRTLDAEGIAAACFRQHTSRALDPQLHTHVVIANRVAADDGRWLALDARTIKLDQRTLSALYHASLRAELTRSLGVEWAEPVHGIAEMAGVPDDVLAEFSSRTKAVEERIEDKLERFVESFERDPTPRERWRLEREAVTESRPSKSHGDDAWSLHAEWAERAAAIGHDPEYVIGAAVSQPTTGRAMDEATRELIVSRAIDALTETPVDAGGRRSWSGSWPRPCPPTSPSTPRSWCRGCTSCPSRSSPSAWSTSPGPSPTAWPCAATAAPSPSPSSTGP